MWCTQPPAPSASRTRRHWPYSAVTSSGSPRLHELPVDPLVEARAAPGVGALGAHRDEARQRQVGHRPARRGPPRRPADRRHGRRRDERASAVSRREAPRRRATVMPSCSRASCREVSGFLRPPRAIIAASITIIRASRNRKSHAVCPNARRGDPPPARAGRGADAGALRRHAERRRPADDRRGARPRHGRGRRAGADHHRPHRRAAARPGRPAAAADRQLRRRLRPYRRGDRAAARHHGLEHPRRARRGHRRHGDGADPRGAAPAARGLAC